MDGSSQETLILAASQYQVGARNTWSGLSEMDELMVLPTSISNFSALLMSDLY
jgi:hypothetical protein